jgi:hypothetical protein
MTPQIKTVLATGVPIALAALYFLVPSITPDQVVKIVSGVVVIAGAIQGVLNVFHVSSGTKTVMADVVDWAETVKNDVPNAPAAPAASLARVKELADGAVAEKKDAEK